MSQDIAFCGIDCNSCIAQLATVKNDYMELQRIASRWGNHNGVPYGVEETKCLGCTSNRLNIHCALCEIRDCGMEKNLNNCGECNEYVCSKLRKEWDSWIDNSWIKAKTNLEKKA